MSQSSKVSALKKMSSVDLGEERGGQCVWNMLGKIIQDELGNIGRYQVVHDRIKPRYSF